MRVRRALVTGLALGIWAISGPYATPARAQDQSIDAEAVVPGTAVYNVKVVTDASPDLTDLRSFIDSATSRWGTTEQKVWALYYWTHILKRQSNPIVLHGSEVTDPIRNFNDFGFTMCSTISGINQTLYEALGLQHQFWDICNHTVSQVYYNGKFHVIDSSMSDLITNDDGVTLASLQEAAANGARLVKEHSLYSTSPNGFLTGADTARNLTGVVSPSDGSTLGGFADAYCETGLKLRDYFYSWNAGHRYVLNLREHESYTRYYTPLGTSSDYYVSSEHVDSPDPNNTFENDPTNRMGLRGNGRWSFSPSLTAGSWQQAAYSSANVMSSGGGIATASAGVSGEVIYKVVAANAIASQRVQVAFTRIDPTGTATLSLSVNNGTTWQDIGSIPPGSTGMTPLTISLRNQVNAQYETLLRIRMTSAAAAGIALTSLGIDTITQVNAKALPRLNVGRNQVVVGAGTQSDTMVLWPDLRSDFWKRDVVDSSNVGSQSVLVPRNYTAVVYPYTLNQDAYLTYRMTAPRDFTSVTYGGRLYNFAPGSYIDFLHSFDNGATWIRSYRLSDTSKPYDVIHYETVTNVPAGVRTVLFKYQIHNTATETYRASGLYSVRMEGDYQPAVGSTAAVDVTMRWHEVRADRTTVARSHKQRVTQFPFTYTIDVGGADHPVMDSMTVSLSSAGDAAPYGYSDGVDPGGSKYVYSKRTDGVNVALRRPYSMSRPASAFQYSAPTSNTTILTDGVVGAPETGGISYWWGQCWTSGTDVDLQVDLGGATAVGAFRAHIFGYPFWDALKGQVQDRVEVLTSLDGASWTSRGVLPTSLWKKDVPINYMLPDDERATAWNFELGLPSQVQARYVKYHATPKRDMCVSELQVFDRITYAPFDIAVALPPADGGGGITPPPANTPPTVTLTSPAPGSDYTEPASVQLTAQAADADGSITRVDFLVNGSTVASDTTAPYAATWTASAPGLYALTARATDNAGATTLSSVVNVTVESGAAATGADVILWASEAPVKFNWTSTPDATAAGGSRLQNPDLGAAKLAAPLASPTKYFEMTFNAIAGRGYRLWMRGKAIADDYYNDSVFVQFDGSLNASQSAAYRIGTTEALTYNLEECSGCGESGWGWEDDGWGAPGLLGPLVYFQSTGQQRIRVQVREDGLGIDQIVLSSDQWVGTRPGAAKNDTTILPKTDSQQGNQQPQVAMTEPATGTTITAPASVALAADATDSDGTITQVQFFVNGTLLATDSAMPYGATWSATTPGSYTLTAQARDDDGAVTTSPAVIVTVSSAAGSEDVVLYAAEAPIAVNWTVVADSTAAGGHRLQNPDAGAPKLVTALALPTSYFEMTFNAIAGRGYRLWIRGSAQADDYYNDSVHVQFDDSVSATGTALYRIGTTSSTAYNLEECIDCGVSGWGWQDNGWGEPGLLGPLIYFQHTGTHTIRVQVREDGLGIDQIVLSSVRWVSTPPGTAKQDVTILPKQD